MFGFGKVNKNVAKVELTLESLKLPFQKNGGKGFVVYHNKYRNHGKDFTTLHIDVTKEGVIFTDPRGRRITYLRESITAPEKVQSQLLNIFGVLSKKFLVTRYDVAK